MQFARLVICPLAVVTAALISALCFRLELRPAPESLADAVLLAACALGIIVNRLPSLGLLTIGFLLCSAPALGGGALSILLTGWIVGLQVRLAFGNYSARDNQFNSYASRTNLIRLGFWIYLAVVIFSASIGFSRTFDSLLYRGIFKEGGLSAVFGYLSASYANYREIPTIIAVNVVTVLVVETLVWLSQTFKVEFKSFLWGLSLGVWFAIGLLVFQLIELHPIFSMNLSAFWLLVQRYPASFSDPNSFGVMSAAIVPILLGAGVVLRNRFFFFSEIICRQVQLVCTISHSQRTPLSVFIRYEIVVQQCFKKLFCL